MTFSPCKPQGEKMLIESVIKTIILFTLTGITAYLELNFLPFGDGTGIFTAIVLIGLWCHMFGREGNGEIDWTPLQFNHTIRNDIYRKIDWTPLQFNHIIHNDPDQPGLN